MMENYLINENELFIAQPRDRARGYCEQGRLGTKDIKLIFEDDQNDVMEWVDILRYDIETMTAESIKDECAKIWLEENKEFFEDNFDEPFRFPPFVSSSFDFDDLCEEYRIELEQYVPDAIEHSTLW